MDYLTYMILKGVYMRAEEVLKILDLCREMRELVSSMNAYTPPEVSVKFGRLIDEVNDRLYMVCLSIGVDRVYITMLDEDMKQVEKWMLDEEELKKKWEEPKKLDTAGIRRLVREMLIEKKDAVIELIKHVDEIHKMLEDRKIHSKLSSSTTVATYHDLWNSRKVKIEAEILRDGLMIFAEEIVNGKTIKKTCIGAIDIKALEKDEEEGGEEDEEYYEEEDEEWEDWEDEEYDEWEF